MPVVRERSSLPQGQVPTLVVQAQVVNSGYMYTGSKLMKSLGYIYIYIHVYNICVICYIYN